MARPTQQQLIERENRVAGQAPAGLGFAAVCADRQARWAALVAKMQVPRPLSEWAERMRLRTTPPQDKVLVWSNALPWVTALLVVRYGEAEYHWPDQFGAADLERALLWEAGRTPHGVKPYAGPQIDAVGEVVKP